MLIVLFHISNWKNACKLLCLNPEAITIYCVISLEARLCDPHLARQMSQVIDPLIFAQLLWCTPGFFPHSVPFHKIPPLVN